MAKPETDMMQSFVCPECGGRHFGTTISTGTRMCHDEYGQGCRFIGEPGKAYPHPDVVQAYDDGAAAEREKIAAWLEEQQILDEHRPTATRPLKGMWFIEAIRNGEHETEITKADVPDSRT